MIIVHGSAFSICFKFSKASNPAGHKQALTSLINWECFPFTVNQVHFTTVSICYNNIYPLCSCIFFNKSPPKKKQKAKYNNNNNERTNNSVLDKSLCYPKLILSEWIAELEQEFSNGRNELAELKSKCLKADQGGGGGKGTISPTFPHQEKCRWCVWGFLKIARLLLTFQIK